MLSRPVAGPWPAYEANRLWKPGPSRTSLDDQKHYPFIYLKHYYFQNESNVKQTYVNKVYIYKMIYISKIISVKIYLKIQKWPHSLQYLGVELYTITVELERKGDTNKGRLTGMQNAWKLPGPKICLPGKGERNIDRNKRGLNPVRENNQERYMYQKHSHIWI